MKEREKKYDVSIAGASFAGLAVASKIKSGRVLLVSPEKVGESCKSACGTILYKVEDLKLEKAVLQVHEKIVLHTSQGSLEYFLKKPFCVIDPQRFTQGLFKMGKAEKIEAQVVGFDGQVLKTNKGDFAGRIFVDASGPQSVLSQSLQKTGRKYLSFGLETVLPYQEESLHFWYEPKIFKKRVFWLFPHRLKKPVVGKVFRVGDAAGQSLAVTGEGIRPAIVFGQKCGEIIENILLGRITHEQGLREYQDFVLGKKGYYEVMYWVQKFLINLPEGLFYPLAWLVSKKPVTSFVLKSYLRILENGKSYG